VSTIDFDTTGTTAPPLPKVEHLYTIEDVAEAIGRSTKWVNLQIKERGVEHTLFGVSKRFTRKQFDALVDSYVVVANPPAITTGRKKS
jgi:hypothetical protein